jgi:hypothetical protein
MVLIPITRFKGNSGHITDPQPSPRTHPPQLHRRDDPSKNRGNYIRRRIETPLVDRYESERCRVLKSWSSEPSFPAVESLGVSQRGCDPSRQKALLLAENVNKVLKPF